MQRRINFFRCAFVTLSLLAFNLPAAVYRVTSIADTTNAVTTAGHAGTLADPYLAPSLRSAVRAANTNIGLDTIVFDAAINGSAITLTNTGNDDTALFGDLDVTGPLTIAGNGTNNTIIQAGTSATNGLDKIFSFNPLGALPGFAVNLGSLTLRHGRNLQGFAGGNGFGGAFDYDAGTSAASPGSLVLSNVFITDCSTTDGDGGGGALFLDRGGVVSIINCTLQNNTASRTNVNAGNGGGLFFGTTGAVATNNVTMSNTTLSGNIARAFGGTGGTGGGIFVFNGAGSYNYQLRHVTLSSNTAGSHGGGIYTAAPMLIDDAGGLSVLSANTATSGQGGGIWCNGAGTNTFNKLVVIRNLAGIDGGGIHADASIGSLRINYSRVASNTAPAAAAFSSLAAPGAVIASNNWWGVQSPATVISGNAGFTPWLRLTHTANPNAIPNGGASTLTASVLTNSGGVYVPVANLGVLVGLPITFNNAVLGAISSPQSTIQASGNATASFNAGSSTGTGGADARVDNATLTAGITITCPVYSGTIGGGGTICPGGSTNATVTISGGLSPWTVTLNNGAALTGPSPLIFSVGPAGTTTYSVVSATDANGCLATVSGSATVTVAALVAPTLTPNPASVFVNSPGNQAASSAASTYAWTISNGAITSATNLQTITYTAGASGNVTLNLAVRNAAGCGSNTTTLVPIIPLPLPPTIVSGPTNQTGIVGGSVTFSVSAVGTAPLTYQWRRDGVNSPGATSTNVTVAVMPGSAGQYSVVVSNGYGVAYSSNATLTVVASTSLVLNATDTGWYDASGNHFPDNDNYFVGNDGAQHYRNWFTFNIPALPAPIVRAELRVNTHTIVSPTGEEIYQLHQVTTPVAALSAGGSGLTDIYNDLADGPIYAACAFVPGEASRFITIPLNPTLKSAVAAAAGGAFALGGQITTLDADAFSEEAVFSGSSGFPGAVQLLLTLGTGDVPVAGYFTDGNPGAKGPDAPIAAAGFTPVRIGDISTQDFTGLRVLLINEVDNYSPTAALLNRLPAIEAWVRAGGRLIVHDRSAGNVSPNPFLLGTPGLGTVRLTTADLDVLAPATSLVTAGPFGILTNASLDGGISSAHGYVSAASLPAGARAILSSGANSNQVACFSYPLGAGFIYYSGIPLDCYLADGYCVANVIAAPLQNIYTPNVLAYLHTLNPPLRFKSPAISAGATLSLFLGTADNTPLALDRVPQLRLYSGTNLATPLEGWTLLSNPSVFTNGLLRMDGVTATNSAPAFFRAVELP